MAPAESSPGWGALIAAASRFIAFAYGFIAAEGRFMAAVNGKTYLTESTVLEQNGDGFKTTWAPAWPFISNWQ